MKSVGEVDSDKVLLCLYKSWLTNGERQGIELGSFLSGAMAVLHEVFPHPDDPNAASPVVPKLWYLGGKERIIEAMKEFVEKHEVPA